MTFEYDSVMALKTLSFKSIFLLISCLFSSLATQHLPLWPCTSVQRLPADLAENSYTQADSLYTVLWRITRIQKVKTLYAISHNSSVVLSFRYTLEIKSICTLGRRTRGRGMAVFNRHWEQRGAGAVRCVCGRTLQRVLYAQCSAPSHKKRIFNTQLVTVALPFQQPIRAISDISCFPSCRIGVGAVRTRIPTPDHNKFQHWRMPEWPRLRQMDVEIRSRPLAYLPSQDWTSHLV